MTIKYHVRLSDSVIMNAQCSKSSLSRKSQELLNTRKVMLVFFWLAMDENNDPLTHNQVAKAFRVRPLTITAFDNDLLKTALI